MTNPEMDFKIRDQKLSRLYLYVVISISSTYLLGALFYADKFHFWQHALSELGTTRTLTGTPNTISAFLVALGMFTTGWLLLTIAGIYQAQSKVLKQPLKCFLLYIAGIGSFITIFPNDLFHVLHSVGCGMMIGPIFIIELLMLWERKLFIGIKKVYSVSILLSVSVLTYAAAFFRFHDIQQIAQKFCIFNLLVILYNRSKLKMALPEPFLTPHSVEN
jgi:hypothetical protein